MAKRALTVNVRIEGVKETIAAFRKLPKDASKELREKSLDLSTLIANRARVAGMSDSPQSALMAPTVKPLKDRLPAVVVGGSSRVGRNRVPAYKVLFGAEFGASLPQFRPHQGRNGYWFFPSVEANEAAISRAWLKAADDTIRKFTAGGGV